MTSKPKTVVEEDWESIVSLLDTADEVLNAAERRAEEQNDDSIMLKISNIRDDLRIVHKAAHRKYVTAAIAAAEEK